jgi:hypothetical protein
METRLPPGTTLDSADWYDVLSAVFDPLDARASDGPWGFTQAEYTAMTRGQQAVFNLRWLRDFMESDTFLEYDEEPMLRAHAGRLVEDAELVGALPFVALFAEITPMVAIEHQPPLDDALLDDVDRIEQAFFETEKAHGALWDYLAEYVRRTPAEFVSPPT